MNINEAAKALNKIETFEARVIVLGHPMIWLSYYPDSPDPDDRFHSYLVENAQGEIGQLDPFGWVDLVDEFDSWEALVKANQDE